MYHNGVSVCNFKAGPAACVTPPASIFVVAGQTDAEDDIVTLQFPRIRKIAKSVKGTHYKHG